MSQRILIGTAWPYANGPLHLGHVAGCYLPADTFARYHRMAGNEVLMVSGSDMHGTPITVRADKEGVEPAVIAERYHESFLDSFKRLGITYDLFTHTHTENHQAVTQEFFLSMKEKGYVYPQVMQSPYCPNEQRFLPDRYVEGKCPHCAYDNARGDQCDHCGRTLSPTELVDPHCQFCRATPEIRDTEHYFFKLSAFSDALKVYLSDKTWWKPNVINFSRGFLEEGLIDSAITRDMTWGIPVPVEGYESKRIYVWFEAVIGYLSASKQWASDKGQPDAWKPFWTEPDSKSYYFIGKDNIVFHAIRWPAALMAVGGYNLPYDVPSNEFLTLQGKQFSTSRNWAVWLPDYLERYDPDPLRYFLSINGPESNDADFSWQEFVKRNNNELVAAYGNLVNRSITMVQKNFGEIPTPDRNDTDNELLARAHAALTTVGDKLAACHFKDALRDIMALAREGNGYFDSQKAWAEMKTDKARAGTILNTTLNFVNILKVLLYPYLPFSSEKLHTMLGYTNTIQEVGWTAQELVPGQALGTVEALFKKLEPSIADEELARLG